MSRASPFIITVSAEDTAELEARVRRHRGEQQAALRARIVLMAARGTPNAVIAQTLGVVPNTVLKWRKRFCQEGLAGLAVRPRAGRPPVFGPEVRALVKAIACELPAERDLPLSRYALSDLVAQTIAEDATASVSVSTVGRWLARDALRPWRHRSWIFPRDPRFAEKAGVVLDLYQGRFCGRRLRADEFVLSADEKTSIQARCRCLGRCRPLRAGRCAWSTSKNARARSRTWPLGMCTAAC